MEEARRFIRLALPGLAVVVEFALIATLTWPKSVDGLPTRLDPVTAAVVALVASGGLGFLFSILYFSLYWSPVLGPHLAVDHEPALRRLIEAYRAPSESKMHSQEVQRLERQIAAFPTRTVDRRRAAWAVLTSWWFARVGSSSTLGSAEQKTRNLIDHAHALGTTWTGTAVAFLAWVGFMMWEPATPCWRGWVAALIWIALWVSQYANHRHLHALFERTVEEAVEEFVANPREPRAPGAP